MVDGLPNFSELESAVSDLTEALDDLPDFSEIENDISELRSDLDGLPDFAGMQNSISGLRNDFDGLPDFSEIANDIAGLETALAGKQANLGLTGIASASEYRTGTNTNKVLTPSVVFSAAGVVALTDAATIAVNFASGFNFSVTLAGNRTLGNPTNKKTGQSGIIEIRQDATGSRTLALGTDWVFAGGVDPVLSTGAGACDLLSYVVLSNGTVFASLIKDVK